MPRSFHIGRNDLFHVHTFRCGHAENVPDEVYIKKAVELGADGIWFADHTPFPGDPIGHRMDIEALPEYLDTLTRLKEEYEDEITVHIGLEIEYLPSFHAFYEKLREDPRIEFMMIGQHTYEIAPGLFSVELSPEEKVELEHIGSGEAMIRGIESGLFDIIAHPDRIFRRRQEWTYDMTVLSRSIIEAAVSAGMILEKNMESMLRKWYYPQFWEMVPDDTQTVVGTDSHWVDDLVKKWDMQQLHWREWK